MSVALLIIAAVGFLVMLGCRNPSSSNNSSRSDAHVESEIKQDRRRFYDEEAKQIRHRNSVEEARSRLRSSSQRHEKEFYIRRDRD